MGRRKRLCQAVQGALRLLLQSDRAGSSLESLCLPSSASSSFTEVVLRQDQAANQTILQPTVEVATVRTEICVPFGTDEMAGRREG